jgi:hypothetical protein
VHRILFAFCLFAGVLWAQQPTETSKAQQEDPPDEIGKFKNNCPFKHVLGCAEVLFTGQPLHIAVGSIAPQNGFGAGLALVGHKTPKDDDNWRLTWSSDAVASSNGSWRAGLYVKWVYTGMRLPEPVMGTKHVEPSDFPVYQEQPVINFYAQSISLNKLTFFGLGPGTTAAGRSFYGMTEHIVGANGVKPIYQRLNVGIYGEINGRAVDIRPSLNQPSPSIEQIYTPANAPGLNDQPFFLQVGAGVRMRPTALKNRLHFDYDAAYRPFFAVSNSNFSFQRLTFDLYQEISLYRSNMRVTRDSNDPNNCRIDTTSRQSRCPKVNTTSLEGSLGLRVFTSLSMTPGGGTVPFYFQPTLGGADINGNSSLSSYQDYRFRAPDILLFRENFEHSIGRFPLGLAFFADQAKLGLTSGDLGSSHWIHSYASGLTLRAGGFPQVYLLFAFGGKEGTHTLVNVNSSLLGTSGRPSLF